MSDLSAVGRMQLEAIVHRQAKRIADLEKERDAYLANLTAVQERCTALLDEVRSLAALPRVEGPPPSSADDRLLELDSRVARLENNLGDIGKILGKFT